MHTQWQAFELPLNFIVLCE